MKSEYPEYWRLDNGNPKPARGLGFRVWGAGFKESFPKDRIRSRGWGEVWASGFRVYGYGSCILLMFGLLHTNTVPYVKHSAVRQMGLCLVTR